MSSRSTTKEPVMHRTDLLIHGRLAPASAIRAARDPRPLPHSRAVHPEPAG
jgi:hypothetical protein